MFRRDERSRATVARGSALDMELRRGRCCPPAPASQVREHREQRDQPGHEATGAAAASPCPPGPPGCPAAPAQPGIPEGSGIAGSARAPGTRRGGGDWEDWEGLGRTGGSGRGQEDRGVPQVRVAVPGRGSEQVAHETQETKDTWGVLVGLGGPGSPGSPGPS